MSFLDILYQINDEDHVENRDYDCNRDGGWCEAKVILHPIILKLNLGDFLNKRLIYTRK